MIKHLYASVVLAFDTPEARDAALVELDEPEDWDVSSSRDNARHSLQLSSEFALEGTCLHDHLGWLERRTHAVEVQVQRRATTDVSVWVYLELADLINAGMSVSQDSSQWLARLGAKLAFDMYPASVEAKT